MLEPTKMQILTSVVEGSGSSATTAAVRALTIRLPVHVYAGVQALSELSNTTKNAMVASLVEAAIEQLADTLSPDRSKELSELQGRTMKALLEEEGFTFETQSTEMGNPL